MMDDKAFKETAKRLKEVNAVVEKLDPTLREDAWTILRPYVSVHDAPARKRETADQKGDGSPPSPTATEDALIERFESDKDADNLYLAIAIVYKRYGRGPFPLSLVKKMAEEHNLTIPNRPDVTLKRRTELIRKGSDGWKIQPSGGKSIQETYGVTRGKDPLPSDL